MQAPSVRLTCAQCQRRKVKCDKQIPCGPCQLADLSCVSVQRPRRPRGRRVGGDDKSGELQSRVARLEALLQDLQAPNPSSERSNDHHLTSSVITASSPPLPDLALIHRLYPPDSKAKPFVHPDSKTPIVASSFWVALSDEVVGLREILDESSDDDDNGGTQEGFRVPTHRHQLFKGVCAPLFSPKPYGVSWKTSDILTNDLKVKLFDIHGERVDSIFKIGHLPSIRRLLVQEEAEAIGQSLKALENAIYFMTICSLFDSECMQYFQLDKEFCIQMARQDTELCLTAAELLNSTDLSVLQAFVIYLAGLRTCDHSRASWTLLATAVRIARAQGVDSAESLGLSSLDTEVRKRLWYSIGILDLQTALDRGSSLLLAIEDFTQPPAEVDDMDLLLAQKVMPQDSAKSTDMLFCSMTHKAMDCCRKVCYASKDPRSTQIDLNEQSQSLGDFKHQIQQRYAVTGDNLESFTKLVADGIAVNMELLLRRPLYRAPHHSYSKNDKFDVLGVATEVLERSSLKLTFTAFEKFHWFQWNKWYALAVVLSELCGRTNGPCVDRAWAAIDGCIARYGNSVADSASGMLWKPIRKLLHNARLCRQRHLPSVSCAGTWNIENATSPLPKNLKRNSPQMQQYQQVTNQESYPSSSFDSLDTANFPLYGSNDQMDSERSTAQLETDASAWVNWEMLVDDIGGTSNDHEDY